VHPRAKVTTDGLGSRETSIGTKLNDLLFRGYI